MINFGIIFILLLLMCCGGNGRTSSGYGGKITPGPKLPSELNKHKKEY